MIRNNPLETYVYEWFAEQNEEGARGAFAGSEWRPWNLEVIKHWIAIRHKYKFTNNEEDIYGGDWEQLNITQSRSKYGTNYIYIDNERKLWRTIQTGGEFYGEGPYKRRRK